MLYALGFIVFLVIVLVVWLVRLAVLRANRKRNAAAGRVDPEVQFREVAEQVFSGRCQSSPHNGYSPYCRRNDRGAVIRQANGSEASLPAYGAESLPVPPEAAYQPSQTRIRPDQTALNSVDIPEVPPPKYTAEPEPVSATRT
ncbi:hypothetical protein CNE02475 [Cryptococcus deneoformans JEC21]|uniref:Uncharacterized protein n=1 Tax=Cryptococcus deneoformans (strain JEC21 / ATCC MYA-565) TaxID=214684 RepID=A0A0S2LIM2_CRYD1|nr:hypothetical protein CNE02475 [Cryptococcus neoformans var. neoformans JEC21]ALO60570.1 hypothetical protein CNE02475 [Cryptococcus neoformans var. neoformans JEC21]